MKNNITKECIDCGDEIPEGRVRLMPKTETCLGCQERREKKGNFQKHRMHVTYVHKCDEIEAVEETLIRSAQ